MTNCTESVTQTKVNFSNINNALTLFALSIIWFEQQNSFNLMYNVATYVEYWCLLELNQCFWFLVDRVHQSTRFLDDLVNLRFLQLLRNSYCCCSFPYSFPFALRDSAKVIYLSISFFVDSNTKLLCCFIVCEADRMGLVHAHMRETFVVTTLLQSFR